MTRRACDTVLRRSDFTTRRRSGVASSRAVPPCRCAPATRTPWLHRRNELRTKTEHFLDVSGMRVKRLDQRFAGKNVRLVAAVEVMHDALAQTPLGIAQAHDRSGTDLDPRDASRIGNGVSLSHANSLLTRRPREPDREMAGSKQRAQQLRELLSQGSHIVTVGLEQLEKRSEMWRGQRQVAAVVRRIPVHELVHPATDVLVVQ